MDAIKTLSRYSEHLPSDHAEACAAVAALIAAAKNGREVIGYSEHGPAILFSGSTASALRAALSACGGAK